MTQDSQAHWMKPIQKQSLSEMAYETLRHALMRGEMRPGEELPLRPVSQRLGISATPLREALMRLVAERVLEMDNRGRIAVPHMTKADLVEIRRVRAMLEGDAAREAALRASGPEIDELQAIHDEMFRAQDDNDFVRAIGLNTQFHLHLFRMADLPLTLGVVENLWARCGPILAHLYDAGPPLPRDDHPHLQIIAAIKKRDANQAQSMVLYDIEHGGKGLLAHCRD